MPLRVQRRNIILHYSTITTVALGSKHIKVIVTAVWLAVTFMEAVLAKLLATLGTEEMLRMPCFLQRGDTFLCKKKHKHTGRLVKLALINDVLVVHLELHRCSRRIEG